MLLPRVDSQEVDATPPYLQLHLSHRSKCVHALPCLVSVRAKEAETIQLYQMKENEARRQSQKEIDKMWHEVMMKETEALTARMELDAIERYRRDQACLAHTDRLMKQKDQQRERDKERLKKETEEWRQKCKDDLQKEADEIQALRDKNLAVAADRTANLVERQAKLKKTNEEDKLVADTWDKLAKDYCGDEEAALALRRRKERELDICNMKMIELRDSYRVDPVIDRLVAEDAKRQQELIDKKRCEYMLWSQKTNRDVRKAMIDQIKDRKDAAENLKKKMDEEDAYFKDLFRHSSELIKYKEMEDARVRRQHQLDLIEQINYNKLIKERARQEELEQRKKAKQAAKEYQDEINKMVCRHFSQDSTHPFMNQMMDLKMKPTCLCSKPTHCAHESTDQC